MPHESGEIQPPPMALDKTSSFYIFGYMDDYHKIFNQNNIAFKSAKIIKLILAPILITLNQV
ncbi:hypothetical protein CIGN_1153 [Campylobacter devanensis]|uniref:Uncharacterized protein n=1 Tax=Campylobacter devanensis TaxID=3161138 RepID=A0A1X9ST67_9BACT|nr:hypothetical protein CIGN_1153 [Campylobacter lanienae]